jgi:hypothetical protein
MSAIEEIANLSLYRKLALGLMTLLWIAFTGAIATNLQTEWYGLTAVLSLVWLLYVGVVYYIAKVGKYN